MQQMIVNEKYPILILDIYKNETSFKTTSEILKFFKTKINEHPTCRYITEFDHYTHTSSLPEYEVNPNIKDCKLIIFCFGKKLPDGKITAARPRSISVTEYENKFEISFLEAPALIANEVMESWIKELKNIL